MGHWRLKPPETAFRLRQPKTGGKGGMLRIPARIAPSLPRLKRCPPQETQEFTAMPVAAENASGTMVESSSAGATAIAAKLILRRKKTVDCDVRVAFEEGERFFSFPFKKSEKPCKGRYPKKHKELKLLDACKRTSYVERTLFYHTTSRKKGARKWACTRP
ncbi:hypothetical protein OIU79_005194 [Salix purpurea]|uniref:Uncharacterized protein n=1 Tax=Salix purpurea TaxID=77065 RepID=A0A9Q0UC58_SALPP|nr:hypothetical protein OIU79_005194 [Salix purpurea]